MPATATRQTRTAEGLRPAREYKNYINGEWVASKSKKTFENRNPADREDLIGTFQESNADDLNAGWRPPSRVRRWRLMARAETR